MIELYSTVKGVNMERKENLEIVKKGLIIVDMINGFVKEGTLADPTISKIIPEIERLAIEYIDSGDPVIAFKDCHNENSPELNAFPSHCLKGSEEVELVEELKRHENQFVVFEKNSTSGFVVPAFFDYLNEMKNLTEIVITGCCTDICILNLAIPLKNFFNQINKNVDVIVPKNAVDTYHIPGIHDKDEWNEMAFRFMNQAGVQVVRKLERK